MMYNKSEIMKEAWKLRKMSIKWVTPLAFGECLRRAWAHAKETAEVSRKISSNYYGQVTLSINGCSIVAMIATGYVEGKTYGCRKELKEAGLGWNPYEKVWEGSPAQVRTLVERYM